MNAPTKPKARYSHSGICVTDLQRAINFYKNVFDFSEGGQLRIENEHQAMLSMEGNILLDSVFLRNGGLVIELLHFTRPAPFGPGVARAFNRRGLTHLSFNVDSLEEMTKDVLAWGGSVLADTRSRFELPHMAGEIIFVTDPDGTRIELMAFPQDVTMA